MSNPGKYMKPTERRIDKRAIALGVLGFLVLATGFSLLGFWCLGPKIWAYLNAPKQTDQTARMPTQTPDNELRTDDSTDSSQAAQDQSSLDVQITEEGDSSSTDNTASDEGVKQDGNSLTVTLEPNDHTKSSSTQDKTTSASEADRTKSHQTAAKTDTRSSMTSGDRQQSTAASSAGRIYRVQAGTFANRANAESLIADLKGRGYTAQIKEVQREVGTLYRVEFGTYKTREGAQDLADDLSKAGYSATISTERKE